MRKNRSKETTDQASFTLNTTATVVLTVFAMFVMVFTVYGVLYIFKSIMLGGM